MRIVRSFLIAFSMYSKIPMSHSEWKEEDMKYVMCFFPLIGAVIGALFWLWSYVSQALSFGTPLFCAGAVALPVMVTGGIHLDGFCDTCDALASYGNREKKLEILKDSHAGAFAVIACGLYFVLTACLFAELKRLPNAIFALSIGFIFSRTLSGLSVILFPCAKHSGLVSLFAGAAEKRVNAAVLFATAVLCVILLILCEYYGMAVILAALLVFLYYRGMAKKQFGGVSGDLAGWFLQICELFMLLAVVLVQKF